MSGVTATGEIQGGGEKGVGKKGGRGLSKERSNGNLAYLRPGRGETRGEDLRTGEKEV